MLKKEFDYRVDFASDSRLDKVEIASVDFDPGSSQTVSFDYIGASYSGSGLSNPLSSGTITIQAGNASMTITVEPLTGYISIQ